MTSLISIVIITVMTSLISKPVGLECAHSNPTGWMCQTNKCLCLTLSINNDIHGIIFAAPFSGIIEYLIPEKYK